MEARPHAWHVEERELVRQEQRRGRRHAYESLAPTRTALVVVDLVPFFVEQNPYCRGIVAQVERLASAVRDAGGTVAWVVPAARPPIEFYGAEVAAAYAACGGSGPLRERVWHELDVEPGDLVVEKTAPSAFFPGRCDLPVLLAQRDIDTVVVAGTTTDVCCESTVRDASTLGHRVVLVADASATGSDSAHNATLRTIYRSFGDVRSTDEVLGLLAQGLGS